MCSECGMYEIRARCDAAEESTCGECSRCGRAIYQGDAYLEILPGGEKCHQDCLQNALDRLEVSELATLFCKDESVDEDEFLEWYDSLSFDEIMDELTMCRVQEIIVR